MAREFPSVDFDTSAEGFQALMSMLENLKDDRYPLWIAEWARESATEAIRKNENEVMRHEHFGRSEMAAEKREWVRRHRECLEIVETLLGYLFMLTTESFARDVLAYVKSQGKPDTPTTDRETRGIGKAK